MISNIEHGEGVGLLLSLQRQSYKFQKSHSIFLRVFLMRLDFHIST